MKEDTTNQIKTELENAGYDYAIAVATCAEVEAGAACGQLSIIIIEDEGIKIKSITHG